MSEIKTTFAGTNPFTSQPTGIDDMVFVARPEGVANERGKTPYDALFDKVMNNKDTALSFPAEKFNSVRSAADRYLVNKNLQDKYRMRQHKVGDQFTVWFVPGKARTNKKAHRK